MGRFINVDNPHIIMEEQGTLLQYNLYAYALNNPINMLDADGYVAANIIGGIAGGVSGAILGKLLANYFGIKGWMEKNRTNGSRNYRRSCFRSLYWPYVAKLSKAAMANLTAMSTKTAMTAKQVSIALQNISANTIILCNQNISGT